jgi:hypothetical protein
MLGVWAELCAWNTALWLSETFVTNVPRVPKEQCFLESSHASPVRPSAKSNIQIRPTRGQGYSLPTETVQNEKTSFNPFPGKTETERLSKYEQFKLWRYGDSHYTAGTFCKTGLRITTHYPRLWIAFVCIFLLLSVHYYSEWCMEQYTDTIIRITALYLFILCIYFHADQNLPKLPAPHSWSDLM